MTLAQKTRISAFVVALLAASALMPLASASADDAAAAIAVVGTAHLSDGIGSNSDAPGDFAGVGAGVGTNPTVGGPTVTADFTYNNPDTIAGDAQGTIDISALVGSAHSVDFDWQRTGAVALINWTSGEGGAGVAAFAPLDVAAFESGHSSAWTNDEHAQVVGVGVVTN